MTTKVQGFPLPLQPQPVPTPQPVPLPPQPLPTPQPVPLPPQLASDDVPPPRTRGQRVWRQLRKSRLALPGASLVLVFVLAAIFAPWLAPHDPFANDLVGMLAPPSWDHPFGTDELGRDI